MKSFKEYLKKAYQTIEKPFQYADAYMHHMDNYLRSNNAPDMYIGYNSNNGIYANVQTTTGGGNAGKYKPAGYSRTAAATAKDIAQGGMTKDEVIEFNMRHPNETAKRSE